MKSINVVSVIIKPKWYEIYKRVIYKDIRHVEFLSYDCYFKYEQHHLFIFTKVIHTFHALTFKPLSFESFYEKT